MASELLLTSTSRAEYVTEEMSASMNTVKRQLVAQDLNRVKQILSMVETAVMNELE